MKTQPPLLNNLFCFFIISFLISINMSEGEELKSEMVGKFENLKICLLNSGIPTEQIERNSQSEEYANLNYQWNLIKGTIKPLAYIIANSTTDIRVAVQCCHQHQIRLVPRSGGHSFAKFGFGDSNSVVIDLQKLNEIRIDKEANTVDIGCGARVGYIYSELWSAGRYTIPCGMHPAIGISGLALGGGYGHFARFYGMISDSIKEVELVNSAGELLTANSESHSELFWGLRGGGGGSFGIVTKFKFALQPAPARINYGKFFFDYNEQFLEFFQAWQNFVGSNPPRNLNSFIRIRNNPRQIRLELFELEEHVDDVDTGSIGEGGESTATTIEKIMRSFPSPIKNLTLIESLAYEDFLVKIIGHGAGYPNVTKPSDLEEATKYEFVSWTKMKSFYVEKVLTEDTVKLGQIFDQFLLHSNSLFIEHYGGAIDDLLPTDTAFVHRQRGILYNVVLLGIWLDGDDPQHLEETDLALKAAYGAAKMLFNHKESYLNYPDEDIPDYLERYYGANLERLIQVKQVVDPGNFFNHPQSIPTKDAEGVSNSQCLV